MKSAADRAVRLKRLAGVGDLLAKVSEGTWAERQNELRASETKLKVIVEYQADYSALAARKAQSAPSVGSLMLYRNFSDWLGGAGEEQERQVAQAQMLTDVAAEEMTKRRNFAKSLQHVADAAAAAALKERERRDQAALDDLASAGRRSRELASGLLDNEQPKSAEGQSPV
jgi:flagellar export protein FliJ